MRLLPSIFSPTHYPLTLLSFDKKQSYFLRTLLNKHSQYIKKATDWKSEGLQFHLHKRHRPVLQHTQLSA
jgi:hypothetical protein